MMQSTFDPTRNGPARPGEGPKFFGKYKGVVDDNDDTTRSGKLKVLVDDVHGTIAVWAEPCVPYADRNFGFFFMPPNGTEVWVEFAGGDRTRPIWTGFLWPAGTAPAASKDEMVLATPSGTISFDVRNTSGALTLTTQKLSVALRDGTVTITAGQTVTLEIKDAGSVTAESGGVGTVEIGTSGTKINGTSLEVS